DAREGAHETLLELVKQLPNFQYHPNQSFRGFLTVILTQRMGRVNALNRAHRPLDTEFSQQICAPSPANDVVELLMEQEDILRIQTAVMLVADEVGTEVFMSWQLTVRDGKTFAEAAEQIGIPVSRVYTYKHRVANKIKSKFDSPA
ncbi:MAG: sigma-70 family RNA polymerase sigma factor, partial [Planctomycetota bacterium]